MARQFDERKQEERVQELRAREEEQLAQMLAQKYGVEYVDLTNKSINTDALRVIPEEEARAAEIAAFHKQNKVIFIAMRAPERADSLKAIEKVERLGYKAHRMIASHTSLLRAWERYHDISYATDRKSTRLNSSHSSISYAVFCLKKNS